MMQTVKNYITYEINESEQQTQYTVPCTVVTIISSSITEQTEAKFHLHSFGTVSRSNEVREEIKLSLSTRISCRNVLY